MSYLDIPAWTVVGPCGKRLRLPRYQYAVVLALSRVKPGTVVPYEDLNLIVYGSNNLNMNRAAIKQLIKRVRAALRRVGYPDDFVCVHDGVGVYINPAYAPSNNVTGN